MSGAGHFNAGAKRQFGQRIGPSSRSAELGYQPARPRRAFRFKAVIHKFPPKFSKMDATAVFLEISFRTIVGGIGHVGMAAARVKRGVPR